MTLPRARPLTDFLAILAGPSVWFAHLTFVYGAEALICTRTATSPRLMSWLGLFATLTALGALAGLALAVMRRRPDAQMSDVFLRRSAVLLILLSAIGVAWAGLPIAVLRACSSASG